MGNYITGTAFATIASGTAATANSSFPLSNAINSITKPHRPYKSTSAAGTAQDIVIDFGATQTLAGIIFDRCNVGTVYVQGHATNSWSSPSFTGTALITQDTLDGRYKAYVDMTTNGGGGFSATGYRYCRLRPAGTATLYGGTVWEIGSLAFLTAATTWDSNAGFPYGRTFLQATDPGAKTGGGGEPAALGNPYCQITLASEAMGTAMQPTMDALMRAGQHQPIVFWQNQGSSAEVYICRRVGVVRVDKAGPQHITFSGVVLEECV